MQDARTALICQGGQGEGRLLGFWWRRAGDPEQTTQASQSLVLVPASSPAEFHPAHPSRATDSGKEG